MKRIIIICCFLALGKCPGFSQGQWLDSLRNLRNELQYAQSDTLRVALMNKLATMYMFDRPDSGIFYGIQALQLAREINFIPAEVTALQRLGYSLRELGNFPTALQVCLKALKLSEKHQLPHEKALILIQIGLNYSAAGDYPAALNLLKESKEIFDSISLADFSVMTQSSIIRTYQLMDQYDSALYYSEAAFKELEELEIKWPRQRVFIAVGEVHKKMANYPMAIKFLQVGTTSATFAALAYYNLAQVHKNLNNVDSSIYYVEKSLAEAQTRGSYPQIIDAYRMMADIYESQDAAQANEYNRLALAYKDSLELIGRTVALETFMEFDEQERQQELAAAQAEFQSRLRTNIFLGGSFTLIVVALLLYRSNRAKQKSKRRIEKAYNQLKSTQSQLIQSEKMASLGELTAGIAHEIQNPLNFVNNFSEVNKELLDELREAQAKGDQGAIEAITKDILDNEDKIMHHGKRAEAIVKSMLQHSRNSSGEKQSTDINALVDEYLRLAYHGFRAKDKSFNATFKTELADDLPKINCVPQDIGRVLLNVINNAFQAVKDVPDPKVVVASRHGAEGIEVSIKDNGPGIPEEIKHKIFQPFFTTKGAGEGTGLGLSLSYDIVTKGHGGELKVNSPVDGQAGTEFIVYLPVN